MNFMKLASHKTIGLSVALALGFDVYGVIGVTIGSILPDIIANKRTGIYFFLC
jgi:hypothetical protein